MDLCGRRKSSVNRVVVERRFNYLLGSVVAAVRLYESGNLVFGCDVMKDDDDFNPANYGCCCCC